MNYNQWNTFEIDYIGSVVTAHVNGVLEYTETADRGTARMIAAFIETYKTNGGAWYTTDWSIAAAVTSTLEGASFTHLALHRCSRPSVLGLSSRDGRLRVTRRITRHERRAP